MNLISAFLIIVSGAVLGWYVDRLELYRIEDLEGTRRILYMIYAEVDYCANALPSAIREIVDKNDTRINFIFEYLLVILADNSGDTIAQLWSKAIDCKKDYTYLNKEDITILKTFGKSLGYLDKEMQKKNIQLTLGYIEEQIKILTQKYEKNGSLYRSLGILTGCLIWILLI